MPDKKDPKDPKDKKSGSASADDSDDDSVDDDEGGEGGDAGGKGGAAKKSDDVSGDDRTADDEARIKAAVDEALKKREAAERKAREEQEQEDQGKFEEVAKTRKREIDEVLKPRIEALEADVEARDKTIKDLTKKLTTTYQTRIDALPEKVRKTAPNPKAPNYLDLIEEWLPNAEELAKDATDVSKGNGSPPKKGNEEGPPRGGDVARQETDADKRARVQQRRRTRRRW